MFSKFVITLAVIGSVDACPAAKKASLRQQGTNTLLDLLIISNTPTHFLFCMYV